MPVHTLSKNERLKSYKRIRILFAEGEKFRVSPLLVYYRLRDEPAEDVQMQMGVSVSSRYFKRAVDRNLLKRRIREAYRLQKIALKDMLKEKKIAMDLFFVYIEPEIADYETIFKAMAQALDNLMKRINKTLESRH